ncbi:MAG: hypothetical protein E6G92_08465 [Alphaproteobacteria bacterium]|nr:MAG: hypothetical protein E6G92_08465 [Alphaproteobacteria bacterium]
MESHSLFSVIPAKAGIQLPSLPGLRKRSWIPAFAGMTWRGVTVPLPPCSPRPPRSPARS